MAAGPTVTTELEPETPATLTFEVQEGVQELAVVLTAYDQAGSETTLIASIPIDRQAPELSLSRPAGEVVVIDVARVAIQGRVVDAGLDRLTVNGDPVKPGSDGRFEHPLELMVGYITFEKNN